MPSKLLIAAPEAAYEVCYTTPFGIHIEGEIRINGRELHFGATLRSGSLPGLRQYDQRYRRLPVDCQSGAPGSKGVCVSVAALVGFLIAIPAGAYAVAVMGLIGPALGAAGFTRSSLAL
jgi:hypothetical protein